MFRLVVSVPSPVCSVSSVSGPPGSPVVRTCWGPSPLSAFARPVRLPSALPGAFVAFRRSILGRGVLRSFGPHAAFRFFVVQLGAGGAVVRVFPVPASWLALPFDACARCGGLGGPSRPCRACGARVPRPVAASPAARAALAAARRAALFPPSLF